MKLAIFDLGKVLINFDLQETFKYWADVAQVPVDPIRERFKMDSAFEQYERDEISSKDYFEHLEKLLGVSLPTHTWEAGWNNLWGSVNHETYKLTKRLALEMPVVCLSNTNLSHYAVWSQRYKDKLDGFSKIYASCNIGMRKPDRRVFELISQDYKTDFSDMIFFDDLEENINAAKTLGIKTTLVCDETSITEWAKQNGFA